MTRFICALFSLLSASLAGQAFAQVNPEFADVNDQIEMVRSLGRLERKAIIEEGMQFLPAESQRFWPVYGEYEAEKTQINDRRLKLITDYAAAYPDLSETLAESLLDDYFEMEADMLALRQKYARRLTKVLPPTRVARFFQLESKLDVVQDLSLVEQIPLAR